MIIPKEIVVGFQQRTHKLHRGISDEYHEAPTYLLGYATFRDKGKLRKETSWEGWRDKKIAPQDLENVPREGFQFAEYDKRSSEWFGSGRTMFRVSDPYGFDLEITANNLMGLICNCDISEGKLIGEFVWAWEGKELALLSVNSDLYKDAVDATTKRNSSNLKSAELQNGDTIVTKENRTYTYIGKCYCTSPGEIRSYGNCKSAITSRTCHVVINEHGFYENLVTFNPVKRTAGNSVISIEDYIKMYNAAKISEDLKVLHNEPANYVPNKINAYGRIDSYLSLTKFKITNLVKEYVTDIDKEIADYKKHSYIRNLLSGSTKDSINYIGCEYFRKPESNSYWNRPTSSEYYTTLRSAKIETDEKNNSLRFEGTRYNYRNDNYITETQIRGTQWYRLYAIDENGQKYLMN